MLIAYLHKTRSGAVHLRVTQHQFREELKAKLQRIGSPSRWLMADQAWDCPLSPESVVRLAEVAREAGEQVDWRDGLRDYAEQHLKQSDYEHDVRMAIERVIRDQMPLDGYPTLMVTATGHPCPPLRHQQVLYHWSQRCRGIFLAWEMGCIAGDAVIKIRRHGKVSKTTLADLYQKFHGLDLKHPWKKRGPTTCKSLYDDGTLRHNRIVNVLDKGERRCVEITLRSGKRLVCTPDHKVRTRNGWRAAGKLRPGDCVLTNGVRPSQKGEKNHNWRRGWTVDNDGYVLVSGLHGHPMADHLGRVPKHRLVMAKHLKRNLLRDEVVHHRDGNPANNRLRNLQLLAKGEHNRKHGAKHAFLNMDGGTAGTGGEIILIPRVDTVESVRPAGAVRVYDLVMQDPARNFVANGVIVHNCGKTRAAADASGGWYRNGQIPPMQATVLEGKPAVSGGVLIVCPRTMLKTWQIELAKWQNAASIVINGSSQRKLRMAGMVSHYHIINYESLKYVTHNRYAGVVLDEAHKLANGTTMSELSRQIAERSTKRLALTGTPISNDLKSVFYPMLAVDGGRALGPSRTAFLEKYFTAHRNMAGFVEYDEKRDAATEIAKAMATSTYFVKKVDVLDLPAKTHTPIYLPMTEEQKRYYAEIRKEALVYLQDDTISLETASARMMKLLQVCQGFALTDDGKGRHFTDAKTEALMEMLTDQLRGRKVVIWAKFHYEIDRLTQMLRDRGISHVAVDGRITSQRERDQQMERFNTDPNLHVFVRQLSMGEGVTLLGTPDNPCSTTIYLALNYRMVDLLQSQDRIHRIGQRFPCSYYYLLCDGGVDCRVYDRLLEKIENAEAVQKTGKEWYRQLLTESLAATAAA